MSYRALIVLALCAGACDRAEPPTSPSSVGSSQRSPERERRSAKPNRGPAPADAAAPPDDGPAPSDVGDAAPPRDAGPTALTPPALRDAEGVPLPQTEAEPSSSSPWFEAGVRALFQAIQADDPALAEGFFFPLVAYEQVKDVKDPKRDWERRLMANFRRDVHDYHKRLGPDPEGARFIGVELAKERMRWMKPRSEGNKLGYYRVTRNRLRYQTAQGKPASLELTSLISWRGEWYLVHLNGFE